MSNRWMRCLFSLLAFVACDAARADDPADALSRYVDRLRASPAAPPGFALVVVRGDRTVFERAYGVRDLARRAPLTLDTPIYTASATKAYTGLLAALLDRDGVLPLDATLADVWPAMPKPAAFDPANVRAAALLSHTAGIHEGGVQFRSNITGQIAADDVPTRLAAYAVARDESFRYANFGPYVWSAMAQARTGKPWRDLVAARIFEPLGLARTTARGDTFPQRDVARCHARRDGRWMPLDAKPGAVLNAAGGIYTSARDSGRFLLAFLTDAANAPGSPFRRTWQREATQDRDFQGFRRDGYGLGWDLGSYGGHRFVARSGGAAGCRSMLLLLPEQRLGISMLTIGDAGANAFNAAVVKAAIDAWTNSPDAAINKNIYFEAFQASAAEAFAQAAALDAQRRTWNDADPRLRHAATGVYENPRLGRFEIRESRRALRVRGGVLDLPVRHVAGDDFVVDEPGRDAAEPLRLVRDARGNVAAIVWTDDRYERVVEVTSGE